MSRGIRWIMLVGFCVVVGGLIVLVTMRRRSELPANDGSDTSYTQEQQGQPVPIPEVEFAAPPAIIPTASSMPVEPDSRMKDTLPVVKDPFPVVKDPFPVVKDADITVVPHSLRLVMGMAEQKNYFVRIKEVHKLGNDLSQAEIRALYVLLNRKAGEDNLRPGQMNALKNDVVNVLRRQKTSPEHLAHNLMAMYYDHRHDNVWRDYCVQHLGGFLKRISDSGQRQKVTDLFWQATEEKNLSIGGTALIAMSNNVNAPGLDKEAVSARALQLSEDPKCGELTKITALQICAKLNNKSVLPTARQLASSRTSVPLRMSAIAAVGTLGDESDRNMLEKYAKSSDVRLRKSAQSSLTRLGGEKTTTD